MGVSKAQQWKERITSEELARAFGMEESMKDILKRHRLWWLGHVARMENHRLSKQMLFGELQKVRPRHGTKKRWRDLVAADVESIGLSGTWYEVAQDRKKWKRICEGGKSVHDNKCTATSSTVLNSHCCLCGRSFRRKGDLTRHSHFCPGHQRPQAPETVFECMCGRLFRRRGDLVRHSRFCTHTTTETT